MFLLGDKCRYPQLSLHQASPQQEMQAGGQGEVPLLQPQDPGDSRGEPEWVYSLLERSKNEAGTV